MGKSNLTIQRLRELFSYSPETGIFTRIVRVHTRLAGASAGGTRRGRHYINVDCRRYAAHRLAWFYVTGQWPVFDIDHIDGNPLNNKFENLRDVTKSINQQNRKRPTIKNKLGVIGVYEKNGKFCASIRTNNRHTHLGTFDTAKDAAEAYIKAKREMHIGNTL